MSDTEKEFVVKVRKSNDLFLCIFKQRAKGNSVHLLLA